MIKVVKVVVGPLTTNCYIVYDVETLDCIVIDPGFEPFKIEDIIRRRELHVKSIIATHCHFDHIGAVDVLKERLNAPFYIHRGEVEILEYSREVVEEWFNIRDWKPPSPDGFLREGGVLDLGSSVVEILHTPGHTPGSVSLLIADRIFTGDTLFKGSIGRTDLRGGDYLEILKSLKKLSELPGGLIVHPGHGPDTILEVEMLNNPYFSQALKL